MNYDRLHERALLDSYYFHMNIGIPFEGFYFSAI